MARHIPGVSNVTADSRSRKFNDNIEWCLNKECFATITQKWGLPDIDLFASRISHQLAKYVAIEKDPEAIAIDAFSLNWHGFELCYAFPPFNLIGKTLKKCREDKAQLVIIVPNWTTQHWYPLMTNMLVSDRENPLFLSRSPNTIYLPYKVNLRHPIWQRLNLICCRLDGNI